MPSNFAGLSRSQLNPKWQNLSRILTREIQPVLALAGCASGSPYTPRAFYWILILEHSKARVYVRIVFCSNVISKFSFLLNADVLNRQKNVLFFHIIGLSRVEMDSANEAMTIDQLVQVYVLLSVFGEKTPVLHLGSKIFLSRSQLLAKLQGQKLSYFLFYHLSSS